MIDQIEKIGSRPWGMLLFLAIPLFIIFLPLLFGFTQVLYTSYQPSWYQFLYFYQNAVRSGESVLWNPMLFSGFPWFVTVTGGFLSPIFYLFVKFFSVPVAYNSMTFLGALAAAYFTAAVAKRLGISFWGQYLAGSIYAFSNWRYLWSLVDAYSFFLLPLLFLMILKTEKRLKFLPIFGGSVFVALGWFSSHWHRLILTFFAAGICALYRAYCQRTEGKKAMARPIISFLLMITIGTGIGLLQIIPTLAYLPLSVQLHAGYTDEAALVSGINLTNIVSIFLPFFDFPFLSSSSVYLSVLALFFFVAGFSFKKNRDVMFFSSFFVCMFLLAIEGSPLFWLLHHLPIFNILHGPGRFAFISFFPFAILAGYGIDRISSGTRPLTKKWFSVLFASVSVIFLCAAWVDYVITYHYKDKLLFLLNTYFDHYVYHTTMQYPIDYYHRYIANLLYQALLVFDPSNIRVLIPLLFLVVSSLFLIFYKHFLRNTRAFVLVSCILVSLNFIAVVPLVGEWGDQHPFNDKPSTIQFLETARDEVGRTTGLAWAGRVYNFLGNIALLEKVISPHGADSDINVQSYDFVAHNILDLSNTRYNVDGAYFADPMASVPMARLLAYTGSPADPSLQSLSFFYATGSIEYKQKIFYSRKNILDLLGVHYIISAYSLDGSQFPRVLETKATRYGVPMYIYENKNYRPLYYTTTERDFLDLPVSIDPAALDKKISQLASTRAISQGDITLRSWHNTSLDVTTKFSREELLVFSENNLPGWIVTVDGKQALLQTFATVYQAVVVPAGWHEVRFEFHYGEIWHQFFKNIGLSK